MEEKEEKNGKWKMREGGGRHGDGGKETKKEMQNSEKILRKEVLKGGRNGGNRTG